MLDEQLDLCTYFCRGDRQPDLVQTKKSDMEAQHEDNQALPTSTIIKKNIQIASCIHLETLDSSHKMLNKLLVDSFVDIYSFN